MIYGIDASVSAPTAVTLPTATISLDFINGIYLNAGSAVALSTLVTDDTPTIIGASGMHLQSAHTVRPIVGDLRTSLLTFNWTLVIEVDATLVSPTEQTIFHVGTYNAPASAYENDCYGEMWGDYELSDQNSALSTNRFTSEGVNALTDGIHKIAYTRTDSLSALSVDGNAFVDASTGIDPGPFSITPISSTDSENFTVLGGFAGTGSYGADGTVTNPFYIRTFAIYAAQAGSVLPLLSV